MGSDRGELRSRHQVDARIQMVDHIAKVNRQVVETALQLGEPLRQTGEAREATSISGLRLQPDLEPVLLGSFVPLELEENRVDVSNVTHGALDQTDSQLGLPDSEVRVAVAIGGADANRVRVRGQACEVLEREFKRLSQPVIDESAVRESQRAYRSFRCD